MIDSCRPEINGDSMKIMTCAKLLLAAGLLFGVSSMAVASCSADEQYCVNWWTIDSGGTMEATDGTEDGWKLSGTIGQWDATEARALSGGQWRLTGGFWGLTLEELADLLFRDRFQQDNES
jgi:hypothetical protein